MSESTAVASADGPAADRPAALVRVLRLFGDVRPGEAGAALLQLLNLFLLLVGYYVLKTVREPLVLATGGAEMKSYAAAAQALVLMGFIPLYSWLASRVSRLQLITWLLVFFIVCVELFNLGLRVSVPYLGFVFYVWVGIFSLATIAQFWSFANDLYSRERRRAALSADRDRRDARAARSGSKIASVLFAAGVAPAAMLHITDGPAARAPGPVPRRRASASPRRALSGRSCEPLAGASGFRLVLRSRYLRLIAVLLVLLNVVNTLGEYVVGKSVLGAALDAAAGNPALDTSAFIGSFYGRLLLLGERGGGSAAGLLRVAAGEARRDRRVCSWRCRSSRSPPTRLIGAGVAFGVVRWAKTAENATDYSVMNTGRQMLWLPTRREEKYKAKQALDTFFVRTGDMIAGGLVFAGDDLAGPGRARLRLGQRRARGAVARGGVAGGAREPAPRGRLGAARGVLSRP